MLSGFYRPRLTKMIFFSFSHPTYSMLTVVTCPLHQAKYTGQSDGSEINIKQQLSPLWESQGIIDSLQLK